MEAQVRCECGGVNRAQGPGKLLWVVSTLRPRAIDQGTREVEESERGERTDDEGSDWPC